MEQKILNLFLYDNKLKFSSIEKQLNARSNKISYHLKNLVKKGILEKTNEHYKLSETAEHLIPYISEKHSVLTIVLIAIKKDKKVFLIKRNKRPFKDKLALPGGRLLQSESINDAIKRIMKKHKVNAKLKTINSISLEHVKKNQNKSSLHSFLLIFVTATTKDKINYTTIHSNKSKIISSDYKLITSDLNKEVKINRFTTRD